MMNGTAASTREEHDPANPGILGRLNHNAYAQLGIEKVWLVVKNRHPSVKRIAARLERLEDNI